MMGRKRGTPVGLGYLPKGGRAAGQAHNEVWRSERAEAAAGAPSDARGPLVVPNAVDPVTGTAFGLSGGVGSVAAAGAESGARSRDGEVPAVVTGFALLGGLVGVVGFVLELLHLASGAH